MNCKFWDSITDILTVDIHGYDNSVMINCIAVTEMFRYLTVWIKVLSFFFLGGGGGGGIMHKFNIQDNNGEFVSSISDLEMFPNLLILDSSCGLFSSVFCPKFYMHYYPYHAY